MAQIETKVLAGTATGGIAGYTSAFVLWLLAHYAFHAEPPAEVANFATVTVTMAFSFAGGWLARHTPRTFDNGEVVPQGDLDPPGNAL